MMKKNLNELRVGLGIGFFFCSIACVIVTFIFTFQNISICFVTLSILSAALSFIAFVIIMPKVNKDDNPILKKKKIKKNKLFIHKKEKQRDEDDYEMFFIDQVVEDD